MPILPLVDLLILIGTLSLGVGSVLKAITIVSIYNPSIFGFSSLDFVVITGVCFGLALVFVARTWLKLNEPGMLTLRTRLQAEQQARAYERYDDDSLLGAPPPKASSDAH